MRSGVSTVNINAAKVTDEAYDTSFNKKVVVVEIEPDPDYPGKLRTTRLSDEEKENLYPFNLKGLDLQLENYH